MGRCTISLFPRQATEICQRAGDTPTIIQFAKDDQRLLLQDPRHFGVTLIARDVALIVEGPGYAGAISESAEDGEALDV